MLKHNESKLSFEKMTISSLSNEELSRITGGVEDDSCGDDGAVLDLGGEDGFLSIGYECSCNKTCKRKRSDTCCCPPV
jgi:hypothetical protein